MKRIILLTALLFAHPAIAQDAVTLSIENLPAYKPLGDTVMAQSLSPGDLTFMYVSVSPGVGEAHPFIQLKGGSACDLLSLSCLDKAEREFGPQVYDELRLGVHQLYFAAK